MRTFREIYCERNQCSAADFHRQVFRRSLYPHARPFASLILFLYEPFFQADHELVTRVADVRTLSRVREEVRDYFWDASNRDWLRRALRFRVSGQRLKNIARQYLPESRSAAPFPCAHPEP